MKPLTKSQQRAFPNIQTQRHKRADGSTRCYRYHRLTGVPIFGEPGTLQFAASYHAACRGAPAPTGSASYQRTYVYFLRCETLGHIKIGKANSPLKRLHQIQNGCPDRLTLMGVIEDHTRGSVERDTHLRFAHLNIRGEWFRADADLLAFITTNARPYRKAPRRRVQSYTRGEAINA